MNKKLKALKEDQNRIFIEIANIMSSISSPTRVQIIHFLSQAPLTVEVLSHKLEQSIANTSMHLRKMLAESILQVTIMGQKRLYSLHPSVYKFWEDSQNFIQEINPALKLDTQKIYGDLEWHATPEQTVRDYHQNKLIFLDVRPADEIMTDQLTDLKHYIHIPSSELMEKINKLPKSKNILVLCRGRFCALSAHSVHLLRNHNLKAYRFNESWFSLINKLKSGEN